MEALKQCFLITNQLIELLKSKSETKVDQIDELLDQRQACLTLLKKPTTENEAKLAQALLQQDQELLQLLNQEKRNIQKELKDLKHKGTTNQKYTNPYQSLQTDGAFYDKRK